MSKIQMDSEQKLVDTAVKWILSQAESQGKQCPFCPWEAVDGASENAAENHLRTKHPFKVVLAYQQKDLDPIVDTYTEEELQNLSPQEALGIATQDELERPNYLFVPPQIKEEMERRNAKGRWVHRDKLEQHIARGAKIVDRKDYKLPYQHSTEDSQVRANEMVFVEYPETVWQRRRSYNDAKIDKNLQARAEDIQNTVGRLERHYYDTLIKKGYDRTQARQVSAALARGQEKGNFREGDPKAHLGIEVRRGTR